MRIGLGISIMAFLLGTAGCGDEATAPDAAQPAQAAQRQVARPLLAQDARPTAQIAAMQAIPWPYLQAIAIINALHTLEAQHGTPSWSDLRAVEQEHIDRDIDPWAALLLIDAQKVLTYRVWRLASDATDQRELAESDVARTWIERSGHLPADVATRAPLVQAFAKDGDALRTLLAIMMDALGGEGLFEARAFDVKPARGQSMTALATVAVELRTALLLAAADEARRRGGDAVSIEDAKAAFARIGEAISLTEADVPPRDAAQMKLDASTAQHLLRWLTAYYIDRKLASRGQPADPRPNHERIMGTLDQLTDQTVTPEGYQRWLLRLYGIPRFSALGITPRRQDAGPSNVGVLTEVFDLTQGGKLRRAETQDPYVSVIEMANILEQICPTDKGRDGGARYFWTLKDSDADGQYIGTMQELRAREQRMMLDAGAAWMDVNLAWRTRDDTVAADPFAIEYQADRVNDMAVLYAKLFDLLARREGSAINDTSPSEYVLATLGINPIYQPPLPWPEAAQRRAPAAKASIPAQPFVDVTATTGISDKVFVVDDSMEHESSIYDIRAYTGSGVVLGDYDGDGQVDLFLGGSAGNRLYRNVSDMRFEDVTDRVGIDDTEYEDTHHAIFADVNNDGRLDLLIVHSLTPTRLYLQNAAGTFDDHSEASGIRTVRGALAAVFFDYDNDGLLDLYIGHYGSEQREGKAPPTVDGRNGNRNQLYRNEGDGRFRDVSKAAGVDSGGWTLAAGALDYNHDGWIDFYLANDWGADQLFVNQGDGTFKDIGPEVDAHDRGSGMNVSMTDLDGDGRWDIYVSVIDLETIPQNARLYVPVLYDRADLDTRIAGARLYLAGNKMLQDIDGRGFLPVEHERFEPTETGWGWAALFFDYDNDGDEDMYLTNGWILREWASMQHNRFFVRDGDWFFHHEHDSPESFQGNSRGAAAVDLDGDGMLDLVVNNYGSPPRVLRNVSPADHHWLKVRLQGVANNHFGVGAVVRAYLGDRMLMRSVSAGSNYLSQDDTTVTFGLGDAEQVDRIEVRWPGGAVQHVAGPIEAGQTLTVTEAQP